MVRSEEWGMERRRKKKKQSKEEYKRGQHQPITITLLTHTHRVCLFTLKIEERVVPPEVLGP